MTLLIFLLLLLSFSVAQLVWSIFKRSFRYKNLPQGPRAIPLIGNVWQIKQSLGRLSDFVTEKSKQFGNPMTLWFFTKPVIFLSDFNVIRSFMVDRQHEFANRPSNIVQDIVQQDSENIVLANYTHVWKSHKKAASQALKNVALHSVLEAAVCQSVDSYLGQHVAPVHLRASTVTIVYNIISSLCVGQTRSDNDPEFLRFLNNINRMTELAPVVMFYTANIPLMEQFPWLTKLIPQARELRRIVHEQTDYCRRHLASHKLCHSKDKIADICDALLVAQSEQQLKNNNKVLTDDNITLIMFDIFLAGVDTTSVALSWILIHLISHLDIEEACYKQINTIIGAKLPKLSDKEYLPLVEAVILETLRFNAIVTFSLPHTSVEKQAQYGKYVIPNDVDIFVNIHAVHHDPTFWRDPQIFDPYRFIDTDGTVLKPAQLIAFGMGRRVCLGEQVARNELFLMTTRILQTSRILPVPGCVYSNKADNRSDFMSMPLDELVLFELRR